MPIDDVVLCVEVKLPGAAPPARLTVHRKAVTLEGSFGSSQARLNFRQSKEIRTSVGSLDFGASITRYGRAQGTMAELSIPGRPGKIILCWDHLPEEPMERIEYQRAKMAVKQLAGVAKDLAWNIGAAPEYAEMLYHALNSPQPAPR